MTSPKVSRPIDIFQPINVFKPLDDDNNNNSPILNNSPNLCFTDTSSNTSSSSGSSPLDKSPLETESQSAAFLKTKDLRDLSQEIKTLCDFILKNADEGRNTYNNKPAIKIAKAILNTASLDDDSNMVAKVRKMLKAIEKIQDLQMTNKSLTTLPNSFELLQGLNRLYLMQNEFEAFPECLKKLGGLQRVDLSQNEKMIKPLPLFIKDMPTVIEVKLHIDTYTQQHAELNRVINIGRLSDWITDKKS
jgi:hypothetical protein